MWPAEAGYHNLACGGKNIAMWPAEAGYHNLACGGEKYRNLRDIEVSNGIAYDAHIVVFKRPYAVTTRESSLLSESHNLNKHERNKGYKETPPSTET
jgi:hypothetical protein